MHGRATSVVLPVLVVLVLVAVVAIASTGSTPGGSSDTRPPPEALLDTFFTLGLVALVIAGVLFLYGLTQRNAIAREAAKGRIARFGMLSTLALLALVTGVTYWRLRNWAPPAQPDAEGELIPGRTPIPTAPQREARAPYEPSFSWPAVAVVVGLVIAGIVAYVVVERRARQSRRSGGGALATELAAVLDETLDGLRAETDPRRAIIAAYARLERVLAANGVPRRAAETSDEYLPRVLRELALDSRAVERLTALFTRAKFSHYGVDTAMKEDAIAALERVRDELRPDRESGSPVPEPAQLGMRP